jgi:putative ABC transport system permease protein
MNLANSFKLALRGLMINKARTALALLGIVIGIGAVITITALAEGLRAAATQQIDELGTNLVFVFPNVSDNESRSQAARRGFYQPELFTEREVRSIEATISSPVILSAMVAAEQTVSYGRESTFVQIEGVDENYEAIYEPDLEAGRFFTPGEISGGRRVAVLGSETAKDLLGDNPDVGETIRIGGNRFEVIGIEAEQGGGLGNNPDETVIVPVKVAQQRLFGLGDELHFITLQVENIQDMDAVKDDIRRGINRIRRITDPADENYMVMTQTDALENFGQFINVLTMVLGGVAAVSLLVGGIGIMNIMLVTVTERTREIGLRKAVGARQVDVLFQFLIEAVVLCLFGGLVGMGLGYLGAMGLSALINQALPDAAWDPVISVTSVVVAVVFSTAIGLIFGVYPAANAARKDPIAALRYE